jgi:signal transduction histidine kinase
LDTKLKSYSHLIATKILVFIMVIGCFTGAINAFVNVAMLNNDDFGIVSEESYFVSKSYVKESEKVLLDLTRLVGEYKNEKHILEGGTISEDEMRGGEENLFHDFQGNSRSYNPNLNEEENYKIFKEVYKDKILQARDRMIEDDLQEYNLLMQRLGGHKGILFYGSDGTNVFSNSTNTQKEQFKAYPSYMIFENYKREIYPKEIERNKYLHWITGDNDELNPKSDVIYIAFEKEFLNSQIKEWMQDKAIATRNLYMLLGFLLGLIISFAYLALVIGRKSFDDKEIELNAIDKLYNDINLVLCFGLIGIWVALMSNINLQAMHIMVIVVTIPIAILGLALVLSLVKHIKNRTILRHTLIYTVFYKIFKFIGDVYRSGNLAVKTVLIVIGYPILIAITFFIFPVTIGAAAWFAFKKIKAFNAIKEGVEKIKSGDIHHIIEVEGNGEFGRLADNINSITDGLNKAVDNELKSERLKTELITNVSHDIRTPLTAIIAYVDLLKNEKNPKKIEEYIEVLDQKSQRLKMLTDDLFEASKASSGNISVNFEKIDIVSLITQGIGELNDKIEESGLEFKLNYPKDIMYVTADGRLLWRVIENLLSNIFKYALKGSRVYIDIEELDNEILLTIKNISAYELNISADELMERFKRGDESRSSQGSGLGLSIAKSLIDIQRGKFNIQVDGDLFKATVSMPKYK